MRLATAEEARRQEEGEEEVKRRECQFGVGCPADAVHERIDVYDNPRWLCPKHEMMGEGLGYWRPVYVIPMTPWAEHLLSFLLFL